MVDLGNVRAFSKRMIREFHPQMVVLFGSLARGTHNVDSDADLLVVLPFQGKASRKAAEILNRLNPSFPIDLIVRTPEQMKARLAKGDMFLRDALANGLVLYERTHARVGT